MTAFLLFALTLLLAVLLSERASRSALSLAVIVLVAGVIAGDGGFGLIALRPGDTMISGSAEVALVTILFTDGLEISGERLRSRWRLPARMLVGAMPLTILLTAILAVWLTTLGWIPSLLLGLTLGPTDPVFASTIVSSERVPPRLRHMLNVESGLNDGLVLPVLLALLASYGSATSVTGLAADVLLGVAIGVFVPWGTHRLRRLPFFGVHEVYQPLEGVALGLVVVALAGVTGGNVFLAAFAAGITVASLAPGLARALEPEGRFLGSLAKFAAVFLFGTLISPSWLLRLDAGDWLFVLLALVLARPLGAALSLVGSPLSRRERLVAGWFGPKGFASVVYAIMILRADVPQAVLLFHLAAAVIAGSMIAHSSTDVPIALWLARRADDGPAAGPRDARGAAAQAASGGPTPDMPR